jgi:hypothetical protein
MQYGIPISVGIWAILIGVCVGIWINGWAGIVLMVLGGALLAMVARRAIHEPDDWESLDDYIERL